MTLKVQQCQKDCKVCVPADVCVSVCVCVRVRVCVCACMCMCVLYVYMQLKIYKKIKGDEDLYCKHTCLFAVFSS